LITSEFVFGMYFVFYIEASSFNFRWVYHF